MKLLKAQEKQGLSEGDKKYLEHGIVIESRCALTLDQYIETKDKQCVTYHKKYCEKCLVLLKACNKLKMERVCGLTELWRHACQIPYD